MSLQSSAELYYNGLVDSSAKRYGILPGAFNPPTEAHLALARSALSEVEHVIFVLPRSLPHKDYSGVPFATRFELLNEAIAGEPRFSAAHTAGGLLIEIAREVQAFLPGDVDLHFLCGRDAAERIVNWDYGVPDAFAAMLLEFGLLVAPRDGDYRVPERHRTRIATLELAPRYQAMSATSVRERIRDGEDWEPMIPPAIRDRVRSLYSTGAPSTL